MGERLGPSLGNFRPRSLAPLVKARDALVVKKLSSFARPDSRGRLSPHEHFCRLSHCGLDTGSWTV